MTWQYYSVSDLPLAISRHIGRDQHCWPWLGATTQQGYGQVQYRKKRQLAHRLVYELLVGPIPDGYHIDHRCYYPRCVYPGHLEAVPPKVNVRRQHDYRSSHGELAGHRNSGHARAIVSPSTDRSNAQTVPKRT